MLKVDWVWYQAKSKTGALYGKDMRAIVKYEYAYGGNTYQGDHVGFEPFAARNENLYNFLATAKRDKHAVAVWVNPESPSDAVLDPNVRWLAILAYMLTGGLLCGIGGGLIFLLGKATWPSRKP